MRLTNITQAALPDGRLRSFALVVDSDVSTTVPASMNQCRHVGRGDRAGSWTSLAVRVPQPVDADDLGRAWMSVVARHGTLRTAFSRSADGDLSLDEYPMVPAGWVEHPRADGESMQDAVRVLFDTECRPFSRPSHRLALIEPEPGSADARAALVIGSDHSHVDMWSMLVLARDLLAALDDLAAGLEPGSSAPMPPGFGEHTAELDERPPAPQAIVDRWQQILDAGAGAMPVFPLGLGDISIPMPEVVDVRDVFDAQACDRLTAVAASQGVRLLPMVLSVMTDITMAQSGKPLRAVFPVHNRHDARWRNSVGWFISNAVIQCDDATPAACSAAVSEALTLGAHPLAKQFARQGGVPEAPGMFAISWLDTRRLPVDLDESLDVQYVSASLKVDGVMIWFIVNSAGLHLRCRYPGTPEAGRSVGSWLDALVDGLRDASDCAARTTPASA